jgi:predicted DNA-binding transcriptional regulator AlpA
VAKKLKLSKNSAALDDQQQPPRRRWVRNFELARYLGVSKMTVWRLKHDKKYNFPAASEINDLEFNDLDKVDKWMEARVAK